MSSVEPPQEIKNKLPHDPRLWARNMLRHPNSPQRPYDFYDGEQENFLHYLADDDGPLVPQNWGNINVLLFGRGCLKTFSVSTIAAWACYIYPSIEVVITAPVDDQREEVVERFNQKVEESGLAEFRERDSMRHMKFRRSATDPDTGEQFAAYSHMKSRTAWNDGDKLRGLHGHVGIIDESQDVDEGTFSTFLEAIDRGVPQVDYFPTIFVIGTPKMANTFFHRLWRMSDKKDWDGDEREWVAEDEPQEFLPEDLQSKREDCNEKLIELTEERDTAKERGNTSRVEDLDGLIEKHKEELDEIEGFTVRGWHIDQEASPLHDSRDVAFKRETYSKRKFHNEVMAEFYSPENDLITNDDVWDTAFVEERWKPEPQYDETLTVLGCDWGGGSGEGAAKTVVGVGEVTPDGEHIETLNAEILDPDLSHKEEREFIDNWMKQYDVDIGVVDEGHGDTDRETLQDEFGYDDANAQTIYGCWFGNVKDKETVKWNRFENQKRFFTTAKTYMAKSMAEDFKNGKIRIPKESLAFDSKQSMGTQIVEQLTAPYSEQDETRDGKKKTRIVSERNDDFFDMMVYLWIAATKVQPPRPDRSPSTHERPGY